MDRGEMDRDEFEQSVRAFRENMREALGRKRHYVLGEDGEGIVGTKVAALVEEEAEASE